MFFSALSFLSFGLLFYWRVLLYYIWKNSITESLFSDVIYKLLKSSRDAKKAAYMPYSKFPVGAALLCADGTVIKGKFPVGV